MGIHRVKMSILENHKWASWERVDVFWGVTHGLGNTRDGG
jgi:hypothetical protein